MGAADTSSQIPQAFRGLKVIDTDSHYTEPPDLWTRNAAGSIKDRVPRVKRIDGEDHWIVDGDTDWGGIGATVIARDGHKLMGKLSYTNLDEVSESAYDPKKRLELLDREGIYAQVLYPNSVGFSANRFIAMDDKPLALEVLKLYNTGMAQIQEESGGRFLPQALIPEWDMGETVAELKRCEGLGFTGYTIGDKPELLGLPDYLDPYWEPFWDFCNQSGRVINFHIGGSTAIDGFAVPWESYGFERNLAIAATTFYMTNAATIANLVYSGIFDRYERLKVTSVESGAGWIPFVLEALEYQMDEMIPNEMKHVKRRPTEYFQDHIWASVWFESKSLKAAIDVLGPKKFMFMTDFPHPTCLHPAPLKFAERALGDDPELARLILQDNAAQLYGIAI